MERQESDRRIRDWFIRQEASQAISRWIDENIDENGTAVFPHVYKLSRVGDIDDIIKEAALKVDKIDRSGFSLSEDGPDHYLFHTGSKTKRCFRALFP